MATHRMPASRPAPSRLAPATAGLTMAGAALCVTAGVASLILPSPLVLLATGSVLATAGFVLAAGLFLSGRRMGRDGTVGWEAAAALVFLGFAASLLADTGEALTALADLKAR